MSRRFVVTHDPMSRTDEAAFEAALQGLDFWHWMQTVWLVSDSTGELGASHLRERFTSSVSGVSCFVNEVVAAQWSAYLPKAQFGGPMEQWLRTYWDY